MARQTRCILTIEYDYAQLCIFSIALQAVIHRSCYDGASGRSEISSGGASKQEEEYLRGTVRAAQTILRTVVDDLVPHGSLGYIPVRSYSRLLGATLILLKVRNPSIYCLSLEVVSLVRCDFFFSALRCDISAVRPELTRLTSPRHLILSNEPLLAFAIPQSMTRT